MALNVFLNRRGFSLIEVLFAMVILAVTAVALMQSSLLVMQKNSQNEMRDEAVRIAEQRMNELRANPVGFDDQNPDGSNIDLYVPAGSPSGTVVSSALPDAMRTFRSGSVTYSVQKVITLLDANDKQIVVTVSWLFRGSGSSHSIMSIVRR